MRHIDWSNAPDWAEGHALVAHHGITEVWISLERYAVVGAEDSTHVYRGLDENRPGFTRGQIQYITPRPDRWDGTGFPPVGFNCEYFDGGEWVPCQVVAHRHRAAVVLSEDCVPALANENELRLVRTPEQIAEDQRKQAVDEMVYGGCGCEPGGRNNSAFTICGLLYDAGYRKQAAQ